MYLISLGVLIIVAAIALTGLGYIYKYTYTLKSICIKFDSAYINIHTHSQQPWDVEEVALLDLRPSFTNQFCEEDSLRLRSRPALSSARLCTILSMLTAWQPSYGSLNRCFVKNSRDFACSLACVTSAAAIPPASIESLTLAAKPSSLGWPQCTRNFFLSFFFPFLSRLSFFPRFRSNVKLIVAVDFERYTPR